MRESEKRRPTSPVLYYMYFLNLLTSENRKATNLLHLPAASPPNTPEAAAAIPKQAENNSVFPLDQ